MFDHIINKHLGVLRATVFGLWFLIILFSPITSYSFLPEEIFKPLGIYRILFWVFGNKLSDFLFSYGFLLFLKTALLAGTVFCAIGLKPFRLFAIPTVILLLTADLITKGFNGFTNHAEMALLYSAIVLIFFPAADAFSISKIKQEEYSNGDRYRYLLPVFIISATICLAYCFVGLNRIIYGGVEQFYNNALNMHLITNSLNYTKYGVDWGIIVANSKPLLISFKIGFFIITLFEIASPLVLFNRTLRLMWLIVIIPFHFLSLITMKIFFWENTILILVIFIIIGELMNEKRPDK